MFLKKLQFGDLTFHRANVKTGLALWKMFKIPSTPEADGTGAAPTCSISGKI